MVRLIMTLLVLLAGSAIGAELPAGPERETFVKMCATCHPADRITKVRFSKKFWATTVDDMVSRGAEGEEEEINAIVSYLSRHFGKPVNINSATAKQLQDDLSFKAAEAEALLKHRTANGPLKSFEELEKVPGLDAKLLDEQKKNIQF